MLEPFNENRESWAEGNKIYKNETKSVEDLDRVLDEIHQTYNGFKTQAYQLPTEFNEHLLTKKGYSVIFLYRKNHLKCAVSNFIAEQTKIWTAEEKERAMNTPHQLKPLDINNLEKHIQYLKEDQDMYLAILKTSSSLFS